MIDNFLTEVLILTLLNFNPNYIHQTKIYEEYDSERKYTKTFFSYATVHNCQKYS